MKLDPVQLFPLKIISTEGGDVRHGIKQSDQGFAGFGEAYFSCVRKGAVKGWKRHNRMTLNFIVPTGTIRFVAIDSNNGWQKAYELSPDQPGSYARLMIPPGYWMAFGGVGAGTNVLLNIASIPHDPSEADTKPIDTWKWYWENQ